MLLKIIILIAFLLANARGYLEHFRAPSSMYLRILLGRNRVASPPLESHNILFEQPLLSVAGHNFTELRNKMSTESDFECLRDLETILFASFPGKEPWALKYLDAWAKPPAGFMNGNYIWYGDYDECTEIESHLIENVTIRPRFCHVGVSPFVSNNTEQLETIFQFNTAMMIGICVSATCNKNTLDLIVSDLLPTNSGLYVAPASTSCQSPRPPITQYTYIAIGICSVFGFFIVLGLSLDLIIRFNNWIASWHKSATANSSLTDLVFGDGVAASSYSNLLNPPPIIANIRHRNRGNNEMDPSAADICDGDSASLVLPISQNFAPHEAQAPINVQQNEHQVKTPSISAGFIFVLRKLTRVLVCFSPYSNLGKLFTLPPTQFEGHNVFPNLNGLHAIRALSIFWVILGHAYVFQTGSMDNIWTLATWPKRFAFQFIMAGVFAVDSFFFLSGFFAYWSLSRSVDLRQTTKQKDRFWFWKSLPFVYLHRFVRITPPYLAVIMIDACLWAHLSNGPFYFQGVDMACVKNWWTNLLYINNFTELADQCVAWGWYLAVDMQFFLFAPFIVVLFLWRPRLGWLAALLALIGQVAATAFITYMKNLPSSLFAPQSVNQTINMPRTDADSYFAQIYVKPYCRLGPYVVGLVIGHIVTSHSLYITRKLFSRPVLVTILWIMCFSTMFAVIYGQFGINSGRYINPMFADALYNSFARTAWGIALGWLTLALAFNRAGPVGRILSWPGWALPARLSYAAYLTHPLVLVFFAQTARRPFHATDLTMIFFFGGALVVGFIVATIFSLIFESPIISMQRLSSTANF